MIMIIEVTDKLAIDYRARDWCKLPYPDHPHGCTNIGKKPECPPEVPLIEDWLDLGHPHGIVVVSFNLAEFAARMRSRHPKWSDRQCRCCLYWQGTINKTLKNAILDFQKVYPDVISTLKPEAMGVNVFKTVRKFGVPIKVRPKDTVYKVALIGYPRRRGKQQANWS